MSMIPNSYAETKCGELFWSPFDRKINERSLAPVAEPTDPALIQRDLENTSLLVEFLPERSDKGIQVFLAKTGKDIPNALRELGRLREITFRKIGEGSGKSLDNDRFDLHYSHLIALDKAQGRISGAYRLGLLHEILARSNSNDIYSTQFFDFLRLLRRDLSVGIEFGRSFVLPEYQGRSLTLPALWTAIAKMVAREPLLHNLIGPVSISNDFSPRSQHLLHEYLRRFHMSPSANEVSSVEPPVFRNKMRDEDLQFLATLTGATGNELKTLDGYVREVERTETGATRGFPPLISMYLELGARFLAFNIDRDFNCIDGLIWVDLRKTAPEQLRKHMGDQETDKFFEFHRSLQASP